MANRVDATTPTRYYLNGFAQVIERIGLAITGALCGLYVAALVARANIEAINSVGGILGSVFGGCSAFCCNSPLVRLRALDSSEAPLVKAPSNVRREQI
jgi:hypothetical protein